MRTFPSGHEAYAWCAIIAVVCAVGCGPATPSAQPPTAASSTVAPVASATATATPAAPAGDPWAVDGIVHEEWLPLLSGPPASFAAVTLPKTPPNVPPPPPASCDAYVKHSTNWTKKLKCADKSTALLVLDEAMQNADVAARDAALAPIESCASIDPGVIRALRVELAPPECGDALAEPIITKKLGPKDTPIPGAILHTLVGQALAARLVRSVASPPKLDPPYTTDRVTSFTKDKLFKWFTDQAVAVEDLSKMASELGYYGKGIAAVAAGTADLRLVDAVREAPIPDDFRADPAKMNDYYSTLDEKLEPRKLRGRDAALVGLKELAHAGIAGDARTRTARALLSKLFGGRRVDALDSLLTAPINTPKPSNTNERLAATLPVYFVGVLLDPSAAKEPGVLAQLATRGVPVPFRTALKDTLKDAPLDDAARTSYAHARLRMGFEYWRTADFDAAATLFSKVGKDKLAVDDRLALAIALALRNGPDDVAMLMQREGVMSHDFGRIGALDAIAADESAGADRGRAAFDAGIIATLTQASSGDAAGWQAIAKHFATAVTLLDNEHDKLEAEKREKGAEAIAKAKKQ